MLISLQVTNLMVKLLFFRFWVINKKSFRVTNSMSTLLLLTFELRGVDKWKKKLNITVSVFSVRKPLENDITP